MTVYDRWFLLPHTTIADGFGPKYADHDGIDGWSGTNVSEDTVSAHYPALIQEFPDVGVWYLARFYGTDTTGWNALNEIHNYRDTRTLADHAKDVAPILNERFPDAGVRGSEWADRFRVNLASGE